MGISQIRLLTISTKNVLESFGEILYAFCSFDCLSPSIYDLPYTHNGIFCRSYGSVTWNHFTCLYGISTNLFIIFKFVPIITLILLLVNFIKMFSHTFDLDIPLNERLPRSRRIIGYGYFKKLSIKPFMIKS